MDHKIFVESFGELFKIKKFFVVATQMITGIAFGLVVFSLDFESFYYLIILQAICFCFRNYESGCD